METNRFSRHLKKAGQELNRPFLTPDANFSRNVSFHVLRDAQGNDIWIGRYLLDLLEVLAEVHPHGAIVELDGVSYHLTVTPAQKGQPNG
jgi:hypothetical protein